MHSDHREVRPVTMATNKDRFILRDMVGLRPIGTRTAKMKRTKSAHFFVRHQISCQTGLPSQILN